MLDEVKQFERFVGQHKVGKERLENRETCELRVAYKDTPSLVKGDLDRRRREEMVANMTKKFGSVTVGIHGQELPQFAQGKDWWVNRGSYNSVPHVQS